MVVAAFLLMAQAMTTFCPDNGGDPAYGEFLLSIMEYLVTSVTFVA